MPDEAGRERPTKDEIERLRQDIRETTGAFAESEYWDDFREYINERRKFGPRRSVVFDDDGPRIVRAYWDEEAQEWIEDNGSDDESG
jgi:hypothetical protein